jgi:hypothetical protein
MARLAHSQHVAEHVRSSGGDAMNFPFTTQHRRAPSGMMGTDAHPAFALSPSTTENVIPKSQGPHLLSFCIRLQP